MNIDMIFRLLGMVGFGFGGRRLAYFLSGQWPPQWVTPITIGITLGGVLFGVVLTPYFTTRPVHWARRKTRETPSSILVSAMVGLAIALVLSALLVVPLSRLPGLYGEVLPLAVTLLLAWFGIWLMAVRGGELLEPFGLHLRGLGWGARARNGKIILDTSAIIDGRIADISSTGFIDGELVIPEFVLAELQCIADSSDALRRTRGRRGLETLNRLQKEAHVPVKILDMDIEGVEEVDAKLVKLAISLHCPIVTNDFNLNKVAQLQGVRVLNINELANAVKPVVLPGEEIEIRIAHEGKEYGQGVGFFDDGTMVVVEDGKHYLGSDVEVVITRVLQTSAGRMIFAHLKNGEFHDRGNRA